MKRIQITSIRGWFLPTASLYLLIAGPSAQAAEFYLESSIAPQIFKTNNESGDRTTFTGIKPESGLGFDSRSTIGVVFWQNMLVGFSTNYSYLPKKRDAATIESDGGNEDWESVDDYTKRLEGGPTLGLMLGDFRMSATYFVSGYLKERSKGELPDGTGDFNRLTKDEVSGGYQISIGWSFQLTGGLKIGPTLVYRNINYDRRDAKDFIDGSNDGTNYKNREFATKPVDVTLEPMLTLSLTL